MGPPSLVVASFRGLPALPHDATFKASACARRSGSIMQTRTSFRGIGKDPGEATGAESPAVTLPTPLLETGPPAEVVTDPRGTITSVSATASALLQATPGSLQGRQLANIVRGADRARLSALLSASPPEDGARVRVAVPGGRAVEAELTLTPQRDEDGRVSGLRWRVRERRPDGGPPESPAAAALRRRLERLRDAGHGICLLSAEGTVTWAGPVAERMLGRPAEDLVGSSWPASDALSAALRRGREGSGSLGPVTRRDGSETAVDYVVVPLVEDHRVLGAALAFSEVGSPAR